jgi:hypothetical protein
MKERILWIVPSRNRPEKLERFLTSWVATTSGLADMLIALDDDDNSCDHLFAKFPTVIWEKKPKVSGDSFLAILNRIAMRHVDEYKYLGFNEDDCIFHTSNYEDRFIAKMQELGQNAIVYGNDMINKSKDLIYFPVMDSSIVKRLGFMVPRTLRCMYADDFWRDMANHLRTSYRFDDVLIQHLHYKREDNPVQDAISLDVDNSRKQDKRAYAEYQAISFVEDMEKLK